MQATLLDQDGNTIVPTMGCYGLGVTRLVAAVIEQTRDDTGITWPLPLAPFRRHRSALNAQTSEAVKAASEALDAQACEAGIEVLLDDRAERPGVKFAEADLIGIPHRIVIGDRGLKNGAVEYRQRTDDSAQDVPLGDVLSKVT